MVAVAKLNALLDAGVTHVMSLMPETDSDHAGRTFSNYGPMLLRLGKQRGVSVKQIRRGITDLSVPTAAHMKHALDCLDEAIAGGGCVYVHCWGGRGRTGTVTGCWLARHGERQALRRLAALTAFAREHFGQVPETMAQRAMVQQWQPGW